MAFFKYLTAINLRWCNGITDVGVSALTSHCGLLRSLDLSSCIITDLSLEAIAKLKFLKSLDISWCVELTDAGIELLVPPTDNFDHVGENNTIKSFCTLLEDIHIVWCSKLTAHTFEALSRLRHLRKVEAAGIQYCDHDNNRSSLVAIDKLRKAKVLVNL
jgi:hypothetical protein